MVIAAENDEFSLGLMGIIATVFPFPFINPIYKLYVQHISCSTWTLFNPWHMPISVVNGSFSIFNTAIYLRRFLVHYSFFYNFFLFIFEEK